MSPDSKKPMQWPKAPVYETLHPQYDDGLVEPQLTIPTGTSKLSVSRHFNVFRTPDSEAESTEFTEWRILLSQLHTSLSWVKYYSRLSLKQIMLLMSLLLRTLASWLKKLIISKEK